MKIGIYIFPEVEVLDFAGPLEVFSTINEFLPEAVDVFTIAKDENTVQARANLQVVPNYTFANHPELDMVVLPGGMGSRKVIKDETAMKWVRSVCKPSIWKVSVCTGAFILAKADLLKNLEACTHHTVREVLTSIDPSISINTVDSYVVHERKKVATSGGIATGIELSLYLCSRFFGREIAQKVAGEMEYPYSS